MAVVLPDPASREFQTSEACPESPYLALYEEERLQDDINNTSELSAENSEYAPPVPLKRFWEVTREHVNVEKIIGRGAFGQVAKGTATGLRGRPRERQVAVKMLKGIN